MGPIDFDTKEQVKGLKGNAHKVKDFFERHLKSKGDYNFGQKGVLKLPIMQ